MGLFWSMDVIAQPQQGADHHSAPGPRREMKIDLEADGKVITTATVIRLHVAEDVRSVEVRDNGLVAKLYEPVKGGPRPGILVLGGSEGGIRSAESRAAILASHGYAALAVAYFGMDGLPPRLIGIPLEYLKKAIDWMMAHDTIDRNRLGVIGGSKGAELALLLGSSFPELKAVVAYAPSSVAWPGIGGPGPSWTYQGKPVEFVPYGAGPTPNPADGGKTMILMPLYLKSLDNAEAVKTASIAVERINGPVLLISGKDDQLWPSTVMGDAVMARLKEKNHRFEYEHLAYDKAGHSIGTPYNPTTRSTSGGTLALGGSAEANARAQADSWPKVLRFLEENLMKLKRK
jgi:dienelactone hydrolase